MFVALVNYHSRGGFEKVFIVRRNVSKRLVAFKTSGEAQSAAQAAIDNGEINSAGKITVVDLSGSGVVSENETPSYHVD